MARIDGGESRSAWSCCRPWQQRPMRVGHSRQRSDWWTPRVTQRSAQVADNMSDNAISTSTYDVWFLYVFPAIGTVLSTCMAFSPYPAIRRLNASRRRGSVSAIGDDLNPVTSLTMFLNCTLWCIYAFVAENYVIFAASIFGSCLGLFYLLAMFPCLSMSKQQRLAAWMVTGLAVILCLGMVATITLGHEQRTDAQFMLGISGNIILAFYYSYVVISCFILPTNRLLIIYILFNSSPMTTLYKVIKLKNSIFFSWQMACASTANGLLFTGYGLAIQDYFVWIPNLCGASLGIVQLFLIVVLPRQRYSTVPTAPSSILQTTTPATFGSMVNMQLDADGRTKDSIITTAAEVADRKNL